MCRDLEVVTRRVERNTRLRGPDTTSVRGDDGVQRASDARQRILRSDVVGHRSHPVILRSVEHLPGWIRPRKEGGR